MWFENGGVGKWRGGKEEGRKSGSAEKWKVPNGGNGNQDRMEFNPEIHHSLAHSVLLYLTEGKPASLAAKKEDQVNDV